MTKRIGSLSRSHRRVVAVARRALRLDVVASAVVLAQDKQTRRFYPDDPIWREPMTQDVKYGGAL